MSLMIEFNGSSQAVDGCLDVFKYREYYFKGSFFHNGYFSPFSWNWWWCNHSSMSLSHYNAAVPLPANVYPSIAGMLPQTKEPHRRSRPFRRASSRPLIPLEVPNSLHAGNSRRTQPHASSSDPPGRTDEFQWYLCRYTGTAPGRLCADRGLWLLSDDDWWVGRLVALASEFPEVILLNNPAVDVYHLIPWFDAEQRDSFHSDSSLIVEPLRCSPSDRIASAAQPHVAKRELQCRGESILNPTTRSSPAIPTWFIDDSETLPMECLNQIEI